MSPDDILEAIVAILLAAPVAAALCALLIGAGRRRPGVLPAPAPRETIEPAPISAVRRTPQQIVRDAFGDAEVLEVPDLISTLCWPAGEHERTPMQARAVVADLYQRGFLELELLPAREALRGGRRREMFLPGPDGQLFARARLVVGCTGGEQASEGAA